MDEKAGQFAFLPMVVGIAAAAIILAAVHGASDIISQFLMAFVITVAVAPVQNWLIRRGLRPAVAFLITIIGTIVAIGLVILVLTASLNQFIQDLPQYKDQFGDNWKKCIEQAVVDAKVDLSKAMETKL